MMIKITNLLLLCVVFSIMIGCQSEEVTPEDPVTVTITDSAATASDGISQRTNKPINRTFNWERKLGRYTNGQARYIGYGQPYGCSGAFHYAASLIIFPNGRVKAEIYPTAHLNNKCQQTGLVRDFDASLQLFKRENNQWKGFWKQTRDWRAQGPYRDENLSQDVRSFSTSTAVKDKGQGKYRLEYYIETRGVTKTLIAEFDYEP